MTLQEICALKRENNELRQKLQRRGGNKKPYSPERKRSVQVMLTFTPGEIARLDRYAHDLGKRRASMVRDVLIDWMGEEVQNGCC